MIEKKIFIGGGGGLESLSERGGASRRGSKGL